MKRCTASASCLSSVFCRCFFLSALVLGLGLITGCATGRRGASGWRPFPGDYFSVQLLIPEQAEAGPVPVKSLLLLEPVGQVSGALATGLHSAIWQELQQILPGGVRTPLRTGSFASYVRESNLIEEDGGLAFMEMVQLGRTAGVSHVLGVRVIDYRPYHPQRLMMEWVLLDVDKRQKVLLLSGGLDAAEYRVQRAAEDYFRKRRAEEFSGAGVDVMLRSPREYSRFASVQAVEALRGTVFFRHQVVRP